MLADRLARPKPSALEVFLPASEDSLPQFSVGALKPADHGAPIGVAVETTEARGFLRFLVLPDAQALCHELGRQRDAALDGDAVMPLLISVRETVLRNPDWPPIDTKTADRYIIASLNLSLIEIVTAQSLFYADLLCAGRQLFSPMMAYGAALKEKAKSSSSPNNEVQIVGFVRADCLANN